MQSRLIVITDLDGTLLDQETYSYEASLPAVQRLNSLKIPLILCSSKTYSEIALLWRELGLRDPFIVENGGAIYFTPGYFPFALQGIKSKGSFEALEIGTSVSVLRQALTATARQCRVSVRTFGAMSLGEVSALTGLTRDQSALALQREYDEPFLVERGDREKLFRALIGKGFAIPRGDRFFHLIGNHGKGKTVKTLLDLYRRSQPAIFSVGLGNSANDLSLFNQVDRPILIKKAEGSYDAEVLREMPDIERTREIGPAGWREAIERVLPNAST